MPIRFLFALMFHYYYALFYTHDLETPQTRRRSTERKQSVDDLSKPPAAAASLDVEFAKSLRDFFRDIRDVQNGMRDMKEYGNYHGSR